jgi:hypothetical protein
LRRKIISAGLNNMIATQKQAKEIYAIFRKFKDIFPHMRFDYLQRKIDKGECVYKDGVAITYTVYKRKNKIGRCMANKGDAVIHQIVNENPSNGKSRDVLCDFLEQTVPGRTVWLSVRENNDRACGFYKKMNFKLKGEISWMRGLLAGYVFCREASNLENYEEHL